MSKNRRKAKWTFHGKYRILVECNYRCVYCECPLDHDSIIMDHFVPYCLTRTNSLTHIVASCAKCNSIKSDKTFSTLLEAKTYVLSKYPLSHLQSLVSPSSPVAEVLLVSLPDGGLVEDQPSDDNQAALNRTKAFLNDRYGIK